MQASVKPTIISAVCLLLIIVVLGTTYALHIQQYYLSSVAVIVLAMVPFFSLFESRQPQARELMVIAVMVALAVVARSVFIWLPFFKPLCAIIIIAGIALGAQAGFLTGATAMFVSNFLFGQGLWTPWQMFAYGLAGFVFGLLARGGIIPKENVSNGALIGLSLFGGLFVLVIVGPLLDTCALALMVDEVTVESALAIYAAGVPVNAIQAVSTAIALFLLYRPMLEKLERVRVKYGLLE